MAPLITKTIQTPPSYSKIENSEAGVVTAIVSTTNIKDSQGDTIEPGAYRKFISAFQNKQVSVAVCQNHDWMKVTGVCTSLVELQPGDLRLPSDLLSKGAGALLATYRYVLDSDDGRNAWALKKAGAITQHSVGFLLDQDETEGKSSEHRNGTRYLKRIYPLVEFSDVLLGAAPGTRSLAMSAKSRLLSHAQFDREMAIEDEVVRRVARWEQTQRRKGWITTPLTLGPVSASIAEILGKTS